ncbi:MAG: 8-oxo-dGTP diphosphatase MutT [Pseudomonadota bacterium]|jgi:8-oxo-dGTP diphosphatase|nr:8-oxo-dGTP diphosphatase MutT [Aestuariibacter sp.]MCP5009000.1 8-oxo-dGTP diphosphatase MutT [Aestuariibacter sp.]MEC7823556.1 8-oxo-dGTP diphosphatase MutT [Pseudomonadota bacterium]MEC8229678.1 8-oxo-dGTP diphosphatase MutT [Pseudomonadota bacterium]
MKVVEVAVGVVIRGHQTFVCLRSNDKHQGGKWEFPGGKVEAGESPEQALHRELKEEIAIQITHTDPLITIAHDYGDKQVKLIVFIVDGFKGEPVGNEGQPGKWLSIDTLDASAFPAANVAIIEALQGYIANK